MGEEERRDREDSLRGQVQTLCFTSAWFRLHTKSHGTHDRALCYSSIETIARRNYNPHHTASYTRHSQAILKVVRESSWMRCTPVVLLHVQLYSHRAAILKMPWRCSSSDALVLYNFRFQLHNCGPHHDPT